MDEERLAHAFAEWRRQYETDPDAFMAADEVAVLPVDDYGHRCARTLMRILGELRA